jgi:hypothetical protein
MVIDNLLIVVLLLVIWGSVVWRNHAITRACRQGSVERIRTARRWYYRFCFVMLSAAMLVQGFWPHFLDLKDWFIWPLVLWGVAYSTNPDILIKSEDILARYQNKDGK